MSPIHILTPVLVMFLSADAPGQLPPTLDIAREPPFPVLWWDSAPEADVSWRDWYERRYGAKPPPRLIKALRRTETVIEKSSTALGMPCIVPNGQIAPMFHGPDNAWDTLRSHVASLETTAPRQARIGRELVQLDEERIVQVIEDAELAIRLAEASLVDLERSRPGMAEAAYEELRHYLALGADCAGLWRQIAEVFFRGLQVRCAAAPAGGPLSTFGSDVVARLAMVCNELLAQALSLEGKYGAGCWPVFPRGDGATPYECVFEIYADLIDVLRRIQPPELGGEQPPGPAPASIESLWHAVIAAARGQGDHSVVVSLEDGLETCDFTSSGLVLVGPGGRLLLPTGAASRGPRLHAGEEHCLSIRRDDGAVVVEPAAVSTSAIFWSADHETGDMSQWHDGDAEHPRGGIFNTGGELAEAVASTDVAHSGKYSARMTIRGAAGNKLAVRLMRWGNEAWDTGNSLGLPQEAYYSAWYYFPRAYRPTKWWNIFQFKSTPTGTTGRDSQPMWTVNVDSRDGKMMLYLYTKFNTPANPGSQLADPPLTIPVGKWVHLEVYYRHSETDTGRIAMWQDGTKIYDVDGVKTALGERITWGIGNYTDDIEPSTATIYIDDAVIATERVGPHWPPESTFP